MCLSDELYGARKTVLKRVCFCVFIFVCNSEGSLHSVWHKFFQKILNSGEKSTVTLLTELQEDLRDYTENVVGTLII